MAVEQGWPPPFAMCPPVHVAPASAGASLGHPSGPSDLSILDPKIVPDEALLRALVAADGALVGYAQGNPARLNLDEWRKGGAGGQQLGTKFQNERPNPFQNGEPKNKPGTT